MWPWSWHQVFGSSGLESMDKNPNPFMHGPELETGLDFGLIPGLSRFGSFGYSGGFESVPPVQDKGSSKKE